jgi:hypothetical protein
MKQRAASENTVPERKVRITWRQWPNGCWEAWVTDDTGRPPLLVRDHAELERLLAPADGCKPGSRRPEQDSRND